VFNTSFVKGNGYGSFFVATFSFLKSIQILSLPFFFGYYYYGWQPCNFYRFNESSC
jgi:hypothetical protein